MRAQRRTVAGHRAADTEGGDATTLAPGLVDGGDGATHSILPKERSDEGQGERSEGGQAKRHPHLDSKYKDECRLALIAAAYSHARPSQPQPPAPPLRCLLPCFLRVIPHSRRPMDTASSTPPAPKIAKTRLTADQKDEARLKAAQAIVREITNNRRKTRALNDAKKVQVFGLAVVAKSELIAIVTPHLSEEDRAWLATLS